MFSISLLCSLEDLLSFNLSPLLCAHVPCHIDNVDDFLCLRLLWFCLDLLLLRLFLLGIIVTRFRLCAFICLALFTSLFFGISRLFEQVSCDSGFLCSLTLFLFTGSEVAVHTVFLPLNSFLQLLLEHIRLAICVLRHKPLRFLLNNAILL